MALGRTQVRFLKSLVDRYLRSQNGESYSQTRGAARSQEVWGQAVLISTHDPGGRLVGRERKDT